MFSIELLWSSLYILLAHRPQTPTFNCFRCLWTVTSIDKGPCPRPLWKVLKIISGTKLINSRVKITASDQTWMNYGIWTSEGTIRPISQFHAPLPPRIHECFRSRRFRHCPSDDKSAVAGAWWRSASWSPPACDVCVRVCVFVRAWCCVPVGHVPVCASLNVPDSKEAVVHEQW